jgi:hypothetical protein
MAEHPRLGENSTIPNDIAFVVARKALATFIVELVSFQSNI